MLALPTSLIVLALSMPSGMPPALADAASPAVVTGTQAATQGPAGAARATLPDPMVAGKIRCCANDDKAGTSGRCPKEEAQRGEAVGAQLAALLEGGRMAGAWTGA